MRGESHEHDINGYKIMSGEQLQLREVYNSCFREVYNSCFRCYAVLLALQASRFVSWSCRTPHVMSCTLANQRGVAHRKRDVYDV